ncbi:MAG: ROK family protein [Chloroflexota bacterium]
MTPDDATSTHHLGLDLGGTNIKWVLAARAAGDWAVLERGQVATGADDASDAVVARLVEAARGAAALSGRAQTIGVGVPGRYHPDAGTTRFLVNFPGHWPDVRVAEPISAALGLPTALINDARAFGLAELRLGAGRGCRSMVGLTLGTGVGGVMAIDGRLVLGHDGTAGEFGHQVIDPDGPDCNCGTLGCVEAYARADRFAEACGTETVDEAVRLAREGNRQALGGIDRVGSYLGIGIANAITIVTPDVVVIGGGIAAASDLLFPPIRRELERRITMTDGARVRLVAAELGPWAGAIGAAVFGAEAVD